MMMETGARNLFNNWYISAIISAFSFTGMFLCFKKMQKHLSIQVYMFYTWIGASIFTGITSMEKFWLFEWDILIILSFASIASWLGMYSYNLSLKFQSNLGKVEAVASIRLLITYLISLCFFNSKVEVLRLLATFGLISGILIVGGFDFSHSPKSKAYQQDKRWVLWALVSGVMFSILIVSNKFVLRKGVDASVSVTYFLLIASLFFGLMALLTNQNFKIKKGKSFIFIAIFFASIGNISLFNSYIYAPNLAYPTAISSSRIVLLFLTSVAFRYSKPTIKDYIGIFLTVISGILIL